MNFECSCLEMPPRGMRGSPTGDLHFDDMKVPADCVLRREGMGAAVLMSGLNIERIFASAVPIGLAQGPHLKIALKN